MFAPQVQILICDTFIYLNFNLIIISDCSSPSRSICLCVCMYVCVCVCVYIYIYIYMINKQTDRQTCRQVNGWMDILFICLYVEFVII